MMGREAGYDIGERFDHHGHPMRVGVDQPAVVHHQSDVSGKVDDVVSLQWGVEW